MRAAHFRYPFEIAYEEDEVGLRFPDLPEIVSWHPCNSTDEETLNALALDALLLAIRTRMEENEDVPTPSQRGEEAMYVELPDTQSAQVVDYLAHRFQEPTGTG